jgi:pantoate--beta-alanine ligase
MRIIERIQEMQKWSEAERCAGKRIVLVPTMGFLHQGHLSLVREGKKRGDRLVTSIFVNPAQFSPQEDFAAYPRDLDRDCQLLEGETVDILFYPSAKEMYPEGFQTYLEVEKLYPLLCGGFRPGHFRGVATVVAKLFNIVRPDVAIFGEKDYQQLQVIRRLAQDLDFAVEVVGCPTIREKDGLALSSRNIYLNKAERSSALSLYRSLKTAKVLVGDGERDGERIIHAVRGEMEKEALVRVEYVRLCDPVSLEEIAEMKGEALLALAVWVGKARLIDNVLLRA